MGLGVGVFFCVLGVTLVIYCITRASGCYGNGRHAPTEIKITYFDDGKANTYVNKGPSGTIMIENYRSKLTSRETWLLQTRGTFIDISRVLVSLEVRKSRWSHSIGIQYRLPSKEHKRVTHEWMELLRGPLIISRQRLLAEILIALHCLYPRIVRGLCSRK